MEFGVVWWISVNFWSSGGFSCCGVSGGIQLGLVDFWWILWFWGCSRDFWWNSWWMSVDFKWILWYVYVFRRFLVEFVLDVGGFQVDFVVFLCIS